MPRVLNSTEEDVSTCIQGSWLNFPKGQLKFIHNESIADFIRMNRKGTGLIVMEDPRFDPTKNDYIEGFEKTEAAKDLILAAKEQGINNLIEHHMDIIRNNQVSLRQDLAHKYPSADAAKLSSLNASKGEIESMRLVAKYKGKSSDNAHKKVEEIERLMNEIGPIVA